MKYGAIFDKAKPKKPEPFTWGGQIGAATMTVPEAQVTLGSTTVKAGDVWHYNVGHGYLTVTIVP